MATTDDKIKENIASRKQAGKAMDQLVRMAMDAPDPIRYWEVIAREAAKRCGREVVKEGQQAVSLAEAMSDEEAREFEKTNVPYGIHRGKEVGDISPHYWCNVMNSAFDFQLRRYMRSQRFRRLQNES